MLIADLLGKSGSKRSDMEVILSHILQKPRTWVLAHENDHIFEELEDLMTSALSRLQNEEPVAYILGEKEFFGRMFMVDPSTLIPRPATEGLVSAALQFLEDRNETITEIDRHIVAWAYPFHPPHDAHLIADIGTGSGCIGITMLLEQTNLRCIATDTSTEALNVASENAKRYHLGDRISFKKGSSLDPLQDVAEPFIIVSNPPYIPDSETLDATVKNFEPHTALFAGEDGTDILRDILMQAKEHPMCRGFVVECRSEQPALLRDLV